MPLSPILCAPPPYRSVENLRNVVMRSPGSRCALVAGSYVVAACSGRGQAQPTPAPTAAGPAQAPAARQAAPARADTTGGIRPYADVITASARTDSGVVHVHWVGERLYFEVPDSLLARDFLMRSE